MTTRQVFDDLHPGDVVNFVRMVLCAREVVARYSLPLKQVYPHPNPVTPAPLGFCRPHQGYIYLTLRFKTKQGEWTPPRPENEVWKTVAHELAHLWFPNHDDQFWAFHEELLQAVNQWRFSTNS